MRIETRLPPVASSVPPRPNATPSATFSPALTALPGRSSNATPPTPSVAPSSARRGDRRAEGEARTHEAHEYDGREKHRDEAGRDVLLGLVDGDVVDAEQEQSLRGEQRVHP